ncbi:MAG: hypothetical protein LBD23_03335 [Oscillospiraceae bacterium]|jgi:hypothetical protein|nr:hypothetical protein [Oscillospiraceae bacterium]
MQSDYKEVFDFTPVMSNEDLLVAVTQMNRTKRSHGRLNVTVITILIAVMFVALCGTAFATDFFGLSTEVRSIAQTPVNDYTNVDDNSELISFWHEFDGERGLLEFYVSTHSLEENNGNYSLKEVAFGNAGMILLKPKDSGGFFLEEGEQINLYALLDITPEYVDESGQSVQIGYYLDGVLYETFRGKLTGGGMVFEITVPRDGEFMVFVINASSSLQNYTELTLTIK